MRTAAIALLCMAANAAVTPPHQYVSRIWRTQDGLPENRVRALAQTPDGYLWIGTSSGLARFDGVRFVVYARINTPSMTEDNIRALFVARDGSLWIGTDGGGVLHRTKDGRFQTFGPNEGLANEFVAAVAEDRQGDIWAGTSRGLFRRHGARFERLDGEDLHLTNISFFDVCEGPGGQIFASGPEGLFVFDNGKLRRHGAHNPAEQIYHLLPARDGSLWLATNRGLRIADRAGRESSRPWMMGAMYEDIEGNMWLGTVGAGLVLSHDGAETAFRAPLNLPDDSIAALLEDRERNLWVGTEDGLVRMSASDVNVLNARNGLEEDNVITAYCDSRDSVWLTTIGGATYRYHEGVPRPFDFPGGIAELRIRGVFEDHAGAIWFGTGSHGLVRWADGHATRLTTADGLRNDSIQDIFEDSRHVVWVGTTSGLSRWDGAHFTTYYLEHGLSYGWVRALAEDSNGDLLVGTDRGLNRVRDGKFVTDAALTQLSHDRIWAIHRGRQNTLWIGTRGSGLVRIRDGKVARITTRHGLVSDSVFQLVDQSGSRLWMSGPLGISSASYDDLNATADGQIDTLPVVHYGIGAGLESTQMNGGVQPSGCITPGGELWFPSVRGAIHFRPDHPPAGYPSPVQIESILIDDRPQSAKQKVIIGAGRHRVQVDFTACDLRAPERVGFRYKLENFDTKWTTAGGRRNASWDGLPPGQYRFRVAAQNVDGTSEAALDLEVLPHFYQTAWFYTLALVLAGFGAAGVFLFQNQLARRRYNLRLAERTRIAREMHDTVVQGCVGVSTLIEAAVGSAGADQEQMLECLDSARIHLRLTLDEARQALTDLRHDSFEHGLEAALFELSQSMSGGDKGVPIAFEVEGAAVRLPDSVNRNLLLVAREAVRNAIAHATPTAIRIGLDFGAGAVRLDVQDDGCGFEPARVQSTQVSHFGILGMRERMEQIGGLFEIESNLDEGTRISVTLPYVRAAASA